MIHNCWHFRSAGCRIPGRVDPIKGAAVQQATVRLVLLQEDQGGSKGNFTSFTALHHDSQARCEIPNSRIQMLG
jgi:hypothetical protein